MADLENLKQLREQTGISMLECQKALTEANGDIVRAKEILREKGKEMTKGREGRQAGKGIVDAYIHANGKIGVLLKLMCESDFVAKSEEFKALAHEIALHIAASNPLFLQETDIPEQLLANEKKIYEKQFEGSGKPKEITDKIIDGKLAKYKQENVLLNQVFVKDANKKMSVLIEEARVKTGEKIEIAEFCRFAI